MIIRKTSKGVLLVAGLFMMIIDGGCVVNSAKDGVAICLQTVVPSLLPFIVLSNMLIDTLASQDDTASTGNKFKSTAGILLVGYLGGYPLGAQFAAQAYKNRQLSLEAAQKLSICGNNPGPSFIFGIAASLFPQRWIPWGLWVSHLLSSLLLFRLLPSETNASNRNSIGFQKHESALVRSLHGIAVICGWVIVFRVMICMLEKWIFWRIPQIWAIVLCGLLEMTNGCLELTDLVPIGLRFMLCALFISFGGGCTVIQTQELTKDLKCHRYLRCKLFEGGCSMMLSYFLQMMILPDDQVFRLGPSLLVGLIAALSITGLSIRKSKNSSRILSPVGV